MCQVPFSDLYRVLVPIKPTFVWGNDKTKIRNM